MEQGVDRIVAQVVDPKVQHTFRPQVERVVRQFLSPGNHVDEEEEETSHAFTQVVENQEAQLSSPGNRGHAVVKIICLFYEKCSLHLSIYFPIAPYIFF